MRFIGDCLSGGSNLNNFTSQPKFTGFVPIFQDPDASNLDIRLLNVLKRLEKRDSMTKKKSLFDFLELLKNHLSDAKSDGSESVLEKEALVAILPFWPRIYSNLSLDADRKVRELNQSVMHTLALCVKGEIAVYLKQIFPIWVFATSDNHELISSIALRGLTDVFPSIKLNNAYCLCARQLLDMFDVRLDDVLKNVKNTNLGNSGSQTSQILKCKLGFDSLISSLTELALIIRFLSRFVVALGNLPPNHKQLNRLRILIAPNGLWHQIVQFLDKSLTYPDLMKCTGELSQIYIALYELCICLFNSDCWLDWLKQTDEGVRLAKYLCFATVGTLGWESESNTNEEYCKLMIEGGLVFIPHFVLAHYVDAMHWDASLLCLTKLSNQFVWSNLNWTEVFVPRLEKLLLYSGKVHGKHLHKSLLCLVNTFPIDFKNLSQSDAEILENLFIKTSLNGLKHALRLYSSPNSTELDSSGQGLSNDPNHIVTVVSGILESNRYLIDRLLFDGVLDQSRNSILANKIFEEIIKKLLFDCLNNNVCCSDQSGDFTTNFQLVSLIPRSVRQTYLDTVFDQIARFINNLANSTTNDNNNNNNSNNNAKLDMFNRFRLIILDWIRSENLDLSQSIMDDGFARFSIGIVDPLRLIKFIHYLVKSLSNTPHHVNDQNLAQINSKSRVPIAQPGWCMDLLITIYDLLKSNLFLINNNQPDQIGILNVGMGKSFHSLIVLSIFGHLPFNTIENTHILRLTFGLLLAELPKEVCSICWFPSVIVGLIKAWNCSLESVDEIGLLSEPIYLIFIDYLLPKLMNELYLFDECDFKHFSNQFGSLLCFWIRSWCDQVLTTSLKSKIDSVLHCLCSLIGGSTFAKQNLFTTNIYFKIIQDLAIYLIEFYRKGDDGNSTNQSNNCLFSNLDFHSLDRERIYATILIQLLESQNQLSTMINDGLLEFEKLNKSLLVILSKCLAFMHETNFYRKILQMTNFSNSTTHHSLMMIMNEDRVNANCSQIFTIDEIIDQSEKLLMKQLTCLCQPIKSDLIEFQIFKTNSSSIIESILIRLIHAQFVCPKLVDFISKLHLALRNDNDELNSFNDFLSILINLLIHYTNDLILSMIKSRPSISRHLLPNLGFLSFQSSSQLICLIRLHQLCIFLRIYLEQTNLSNQTFHDYLICLGLCRVWTASLIEPHDMSLDFGCLNLSTSNTNDDPHDFTDPNMFHRSASNGIVLGQTSQLFVKYLGSIWYNLTNDYTIEKLQQIFNDQSIEQFICKSQTHSVDECMSLVRSSLNALLLNRIRTIHPNQWPLELKCKASCVDFQLSWIQTYIGQLDDKNNSKFNQCLELYLPAGIARRCLARQELLGHLKSLASDFHLNLESICGKINDENVQLSLEQLDQFKLHAKVIELISSLVSVRLTAPIYLTTFSSLIFDDYQVWFTNLTDSMSENNHTMSKESMNVILSIMTYLECLLLLWQPWQWNLVDDDCKYFHRSGLGLVQLSMRIQQLRPLLTSNHWDFILCVITSWVSSCTDRLLNMEYSVMNCLLAYRAYRTSAALGALFIQNHPILIDQNNVLIKQKSFEKGIIPISTDYLIEPNESNILNDEDYVQSMDDFQDEFESATGESGIQIESKQVDDDDAFWESSCMDDENLLDLNESIELENDDEEGFSNDDLIHILAKGLPFVPRRGQLSNSIRSDWTQFFENHLYSTLIPLIFKLCLTNPIELGHSNPMLNTEFHIQSLCASFANCPPNRLIQILTDQPNLVVEYLMSIRTDLDQSNCPNHQLVQTKDASIMDFTNGFRASLDFVCRLMSYSPVQSGQLLGHILLNRLITIQLNLNEKGSTSIANHLLCRLPSVWLNLLHGFWPIELENYLQSSDALNYWGLGCSFHLIHLITLDQNSNSKWILNVSLHQSILGYLLAWDSLLTLMTITGPQGRACLQNSLLGSSSLLFDRFMLLLGLLLPPSTNLIDCIKQPSRLEPDKRLLLLRSTSRTYLDMILSIYAGRKSNNRRPLNLMNYMVSGDDREWRDLFGPEDSLVCMPGHRLLNDLSHFAVRLFHRFLAEAPALMRGWHNQLSLSNSGDLTTQSTIMSSHKPGRLRQFGSLINKIVGQYFSSGLARDETVMIQYRSYLRMAKNHRDSSKSFFSFLNRTPENGTVRIKSRPLSREIIATYYLDDHSLEMLIELPLNYPFGLISVSKGRGIGLSDQHWPSWIVQLSIFINNHNGSILDGIDLWQNNVRKRFEGVDECAICYSIIHNTNFSLPKMQCYTCKKLFHYACMYKWFKTSKKPACPLCRKLFLNLTGRS